MTRPLYAETTREPVGRNPQGHAGLWYDKFCNTWDRAGWSLASSGSANPKLDWVKTVADRRVGDVTQLAEYVRRMVQLVESRGGRWAALTTESRFVTGLGRSHPVENGFAWHSTLGVPFLPGSSVKGMAHAWAEAEGTSPDQVQRIFGEQDRGGGIAFLDAVPVEPVQLEADVMTPHYAGWSPEDPPGDWRSPLPVYFLTTAARSTFLFGILPTGGTSVCDLHAAWTLIDDALAWAGAGAKTAVGYGRLVEAGGTAQVEQRQAELEALQAERERERQAERERRELLALLSPVERQIAEALENRSNPNEPETTAIYGMINRGTWTGPEQLEAAQWLADRMRAEGKWKETTNTRRPERDRDHQRTLQVMEWLQGR